jgi:hypothetical protein
MSDVGVRTMQLPWDSIFAVFRRACPKLGSYGGDFGGDAPKMLKLLADNAEVERVAVALNDIEIDYRIATKSHQAAIAAAAKKRSDAIDALSKTIKP